MSATTNASCDISPCSLVLQSSGSFPASSLTAGSGPTTPNTSTTLTPMPTSMSAMRRVAPPNSSSHSSYSPTQSASTSTSWYSIPTPTQSLNNHNNNPFQIFRDAQAGAQDPHSGELDLATSKQLMRMKYSYDIDVDDTLKGRQVPALNVDVTPNKPSSTAPARERGMTFSETEVTTARMPPWSISTAKGHRAGESRLGQGGVRGTIERTRSSSQFEGLESDNNLSQQYHPRPNLPAHSNPQPRPKTFWEGELAAQREIDEDDYAWYYRNPQRYTWRPRAHNGIVSMRLKVYSRRRRVMCGVATGEEGAPTNMSLFAAYVVRHFKDVRVGVMGESDVNAAESTGGKKKNGPAAGTGMTGIQQGTLWNSGMQSTMSGDDESTLPTMEDWQEELFSPVENGNPSSHRFRRASRSSSIETYSSSSTSSSSAPLSHGRLSCNVSLEAERSWGIIDHHGSSGGDSSKMIFKPSPRLCPVGHQFSFFRVIST